MDDLTLTHTQYFDMALAAFKMTCCSGIVYATTQYGNCRCQNTWTSHSCSSKNVSQLEVYILYGDMLLNNKQPNFLSSGLLNSFKFDVDSLSLPILGVYQLP